MVAITTPTVPHPPHEAFTHRPLSAISRTESPVPELGSPPRKDSAVAQDSTPPCPLAPLAKNPASLTAENLHQSQDQYRDKSLVQKKRKYSADLYEYTKGMWATIREDIDRRKTGDDAAAIADSTYASTDSMASELDNALKLDEAK